MENFIKIILEASVTAGIAVFAVMLIRLAMKKAPKRWAYALWAVVFFRCLCPFSVESGLSVFNAVNAVPERTAEVEQLETLPQMAENSEIENILPVNTNLNTYGYQTAAPVYPAVLEDVTAAEAVPTKKPVNKYAIMFAVWAAGAGAMALYGIVSYVLLMGRLRTAVKTEEGVYESDRISTAFSAGFFPPKIYLPCGLFEEEKKLIVAHERVHIRRLDYIVKPVAFLALAVHWFNPLIWLSFALMTRDMELSCDEAVLKIFGAGEKKAYSEALLRVSMKRSGLADNYGFLPLAFAETGIKGRVRNVLKYKKPTVIVTVIAAAVVVAACVVLGTNAKSADDATGGEIEYTELSNSDGLTEKLTDVNGNNIYFAVTNNYSDKSGVYLSDYYDFDKAFFEAQPVPDFDPENAADFDINAVNRFVTDIDIDELKINALEIYEEGGKRFLKAEFNIVTEENPTLFMRDDLIRIDGEYETKLFFVEGGGEKGVSVRAEYELTQNWENGDYVFVLKGFGDIPVYVNKELLMEDEIKYVDYQSGRANRLRDDNGNKIYLYVDKNFYDDPHETDGVYYSRALIEGEEVQGMDSTAFSFSDGSLKKLIMAVDMTELKINSLEVFNENGKSFLKTQLEFTLAEDVVQPIKDGLIRYGGDEEPRLLTVDGGGKDRVYTVSAEYELTQNGENGYAFILKDFEDIPVYVNAELVKEKEQNYDTLEAGETSYSFESGEKVVINNIPDKTMKVNDDNNGKLRNSMTLNSDPDASGKERSVWVGMQGKNNELDRQCCVDLSYVDIIGLSIEDIEISSEQYTVTMKITYGNREDSGFYVNPQELNAPMRLIKHSDTESMLYLTAEYDRETVKEYQIDLYGFDDIPVETGDGFMIRNNAAMTYPEGHISYNQVISGNENLSLDGHIPAYFVCGYSPSSTGVISHSDNADGNSGVVSYESFNNDFEWSFQNAYLGGVSQITVNSAGDNCVHILGMKTKSDFTAADSVLNFGDFTINEITLEDMYTENSGGRVKLYTKIKVEAPDEDGLMNNMAVNDGSYEMAVAKSADGGYVFTVITDYSANDVDSFGVVLEGFTWQKKYVHPDLLLNKGGFYTAEYMAAYENASAEEVYISDNLINIVLYDNGLFQIEEFFSSYIPTFCSQKQYRREGGSLILTFDDGSELCFDETYSTGEPSKAALTFNEKASRRTDARSRDIPWFNDGAVFTFDEEWLEVERKSEEERKAEEAERKLRELDEQERFRAEEALKSSYPALQYPVSANINAAYSEDNVDLDFAVQEGTPVYAAGKGTVINADDDQNGYGLCVIIDHGAGSMHTVYAYLSEISVSEGDEVNAGDLIGYSGKTGNTYGAQLHFEVRIDGRHVDPAEYISPVLSYPAQGDISENYGDGHNGIDFTAAKGEEIYAAYDGTVTEVGTGWNGGYGHSVTIDHGSGMETVYAHLSEISVSEGDKVHKRDVIGYAGSTGDSVGTHLHFEVKINGRQANPMNYLGLRHFDGDDTEMETIELKGKTYYLVFTEAQLRAIGSGVYGLDKNYMQQCDIELSSDEWQPIGTRENPFTGSYNGNGFEIKGLTMTDPYASLAGMFGYAKNAKIYNITLRDIDIEKAGSSAESMSSGAVVAINLGSEVYDNTVY